MTHYISAADVVSMAGEAYIPGEHLNPLDDVEWILHEYGFDVSLLEPSTYPVINIPTILIEKHSWPLVMPRLYDTDTDDDVVEYERPDLTETEYELVADYTTFETPPNINKAPLTDPCFNISVLVNCMLTR